MLISSGPAPLPTTPADDRLPLPELCADLWRDTMGDQGTCLEWLLDMIEQKQRPAR